jgi:hypothetical protein
MYVCVLQGRKTKLYPALTEREKGNAAYNNRRINTYFLITPVPVLRLLILSKGQCLCT